MINLSQNGQKFWRHVRKQTEQNNERNFKNNIIICFIFNIIKESGDKTNFQINKSGQML